MHKLLILLVFTQCLCAQENPSVALKMYANDGFWLTIHADMKYEIRHVGIGGRHSTPCPRRPCQRKGTIDPAVLEMFLLALEQKGLFTVKQSALDDKMGKSINVADGGSYTIEVKSHDRILHLTKPGLTIHAKHIPQNPSLQTVVGTLAISQAFTSLLFEKARP